MKIEDLYNNVKAAAALEPAAVGTTGIAGGSLSPAIDRLGYQGVTFILGYGTSLATGDTVTPIVYESDASTGGFTSVADADLIGTEADAAFPAVTGRVSGTSQNFFSKLGYKGKKRYVKVRLYGLGTATCVVSAVALLHSPRHAPVS